MSSSPIISVRNLSKKYRLGLVSEDFLANKAINAVKRLFQRNDECHRPEDIWALKDVSFDIMPGEVVGIIGHNGAGRSTLLKILSRITEPSEGEIHMHGRVASLLEVGLGFHPELTGRENIFLDGSRLGMTQRDIRKKRGMVRIQ